MAITKIEVPELFDFGSDNSAFKLPTGTTAERPTSPSNGEMRFNTTTGYVEYYDTTDTQWWEIDYAPILPSENFNTVLYTGDGTSSNAITGVGFEPSLTWIKDRGAAAGHWVNDSVRGAGKGIMTQSTSAEITSLPELMSSFDSDGFTVGYISNNTTNFLNNSYVAWNWKAGGAARNNTDGSIASLVSANTAAGFSIVSYTGNSTVGATIGHGLGVKPELFFIKELSATRDWIAWCNEDNTKLGYLNYTDAFDSSRYSWALNSTQPTSTTITFSNDAATNGSGNYIAYCWRSIAGYSKIGSFVGNGSTVNVVTGFEPAFIMWKNTTRGNASYDYWFIVDNKTSPSNPVNKVLYPNDSIAESTTSYTIANFNSNGFDIVGAAGGNVFNASGQTYIYMAFATNPT